MSLDVIEVKGTIKLITGLHIGAGNDEIHIGGIDNPVVKDRNGYPYIPGSSLKGKMRSLLELADNISYGGKPSTIAKSPESAIPRMFGDTTDGNITRLLFRDAFLSEESKRILSEKSILATEAKNENSINRLRGTAENPRITERAISGLEFDFEIIVRLFDGDSEDTFKDTLVRGMKMLEKDALGGSGSRGYGKVKFQNVKWGDKELEL